MAEPTDDWELQSTLPKPWERQASFGELLLERLRKAPWLALSLAAHMVLIGIVMLFASANLGSRERKEVVAQFERERENPFVVEEPPPPTPVEAERTPTDEPVLVEEEPDLPDPAKEEPEPSAGEPDLFSNDPFLERASSNLLGMGGDPGGIHGQRIPAGKGLRRVGSGTATEPALRSALHWLKDHQDPDGRWDSDGFSKNCETNPCDGPGEALHDVGVTGLALLAFLGDGNTLRTGPYRSTVVNAVRWLIDQQDRDTGLLGEKAGNGYLYSHSIATLALCEAYYFGKSPTLRGPAQKAVNLILNARNPYKAWRYEFPPNGDNDTSVTGWMVFALKSAEEAGLQIDKTAYDGALAWFDEMTDPATGRCGYQQKGEPSSRRTGTESRFPPDKTESLTAVSLLCRIFLGQTPAKHPVMSLQAERLRKAPPVWEVTPDRCLVDEYYWYYGTFAMFQMGGEDWKVWNTSMKRAVLEHQRPDGDEKGSWDPIGAWGKDGGRVYMTAIGALCLEVYFRYAKILGARPVRALPSAVPANAGAAPTRAESRRSEDPRHPRRRPR